MSIGKPQNHSESTVNMNTSWESVHIHSCDLPRKKHPWSTFALRRPMKWMHLPLLQHQHSYLSFLSEYFANLLLLLLMSLIACLPRLAPTLLVAVYQNLLTVLDTQPSRYLPILLLPKVKIISRVRHRALVELRAKYNFASYNGIPSPQSSKICCPDHLPELVHISFRSPASLAKLSHHGK